MIPQAEIDQIRADAKALLLDTGRVLAHTVASDDGGGQTESYVAGDSLPCAIAPVGDRGQGGLAGDQVDERTTHITTWPHDTAIRAVDRVEVNGRTYSVTRIPERGALTFTRRVEIREV